MADGGPSPGAEVVAVAALGPCRSTPERCRWAREWCTQRTACARTRIPRTTPPVPHSFARLRVGAVQTCRFARICLKEAIEYAQARKTFGKRLVDHQVFTARTLQCSRAAGIPPSCLLAPNPLPVKMWQGVSPVPAQM